MLAERHFRQQRHRAYFTKILPLRPWRERGFRGEERQWRLAERLQRPQRAAAVEPDRAERIGFGKARERAASKATAPPQRTRVWITASPGRDEPLRIGLGESLYLAQPETQRPAPAISSCVNALRAS